MLRFVCGLLFASTIFSSCVLSSGVNGRKEDLDYPSGLHVVGRSDWGWKALTQTLPTHQINKITIHHGGVDFPDDRDPANYLQDLQQWSRREKDWIDIPYHYMIDLDGHVYEARPLNYPGDTNTTYNPRGHALICVMGNYENQFLKRIQLEAVIELTAVLALEFSVDIDAIRGHKDYADTLCPGADLYGYLHDGTLRRAVRKLINQKALRRLGG